MKGRVITAKRELADCERALRWIRDPNPDFDEVCGYAGLEPDATRRELIAAVNGDTRDYAYYHYDNTEGL